MTQQHPHDDDDDPTIIDGEIIDGEIVEDSFAPDPYADDEVTARLDAIAREFDDEPVRASIPLAPSLHALADEAGEPRADLGAAVLAGARRVRRRRYATTAVTAVAVLSLSATAVAAGPWGGREQADRLVAAAPTVSASVDTSTSVPAAPVPSSPAPSSPAPAATASSTSATGPAAVLPGTSSARPPASGGDAVAPAPVAPAPTTRAPRPAPLRLSVTPGGATVQPGETVRFALSWSDGDGRYGGSTADWGDGTPGSGGDAAIDRCSEVPSPNSGSDALSHSWTTPGEYTVTLSLSTYDCTTYRLETRTVTRTVVVEAPPSPSPSATSPAPEPSAG